MWSRKARTPLLEIVLKRLKEPLGSGAVAAWSGCNILELAMIAEYSGRQVGTQLLVLFFYISSSKVRRGTLREAKQPDPSTLAWCKYEVKLFHFVYFSLSIAPWNAKGHKIELFEMWSSALIFFFIRKQRHTVSTLRLWQMSPLGLTLDSVPSSIVGGIS